MPDTKRLPLSAPFLLLIFANLWVGLFLLLLLRGHDFRWGAVFFAVAAAAHAAFFCSVGAFLVGWLAGRLRPFWVSFLWATALFASTIVLVEWLSFKYFGLDPREGIQLGLQFILHERQLISFVVLLSGAAAPLALGLVFAGVAVAHAKISAWYPGSIRRVKPSWVAGFALGSALLAVLTQTYAFGFTSDRARESQIKNPFFLASFLYPPPSLAALESPCFQGVPSEGLQDAKYNEARLSPATHRPNIYFILIDSLRADMIDAKLTPHLFALKKNSLPVKRFRTSSNCSHISWFSMLNAVEPLYWHSLSVAPVQKGSSGLRLLKALGYQNHLFSSAGTMEGYNLRASIFGQSWEAVDHRDVVTQGSDHYTEDQMGRKEQEFIRTLKRFNRDPKMQSGNFYFVALFGPHWPYSWPADYQPAITPFAPLLTWADLVAQSPERRHLLLNRYRNSVAATDKLVGELLTDLRETAALQNSLVIVTGDHGEEFGEEGGLMHGTALNSYQLEAALLVSLPQYVKTHPREIPLASSLDIFPTIFDVVGGEEIGRGLFQGVSLLRDVPYRHAISAWCTAYTPTIFAYSDEKHSVRFELDSAAEHGEFVYAREMRVTGMTGTEPERPDAAPAASPEALLNQVAQSMGACP